MTTPGAVLVVDGKAESRANLARHAKEAGYPVLEAATGAEALALLSSLHPQMVLLDLDQLDVNGLDLARQIKLEAADVPVVLLSTTGDRDVVVKGMRTGAYDVLVKPVAAQAVKDVLKAAATQVDAAPLIVSPGGNGSGGAAPPVDVDLLFRNSERMRAVEDIVRRAADTNATILLQGESGTGKELVARAIHYSRIAATSRSSRSTARPSRDLLESELFGHEKGPSPAPIRRSRASSSWRTGAPSSWTRSATCRSGCRRSFSACCRMASSCGWAAARRSRSTCGSSPPPTGTSRRSMTHRALSRGPLLPAERGRDLHPPLRERREEIPVLVDYFMGRFCRQYNRDALKISQATMRLLQDYHWPGNVRELENMIKRAVVLQTEALVQQEIALRSEKPWAPKAEGAPAPAAASPAAAPPAPVGGVMADSEMGLKDIARRAAMAAEKAVIKEVLEKVRWNRAEAARLLKISYKAMLYKIRQVGLDDRPERGSGRK